MITSEIHGSVSKNCVELNELPNDGKINNTYGDEIIEEHENINSIENEFEPFVGQCFPSEEKAFIFYKNYANRYGFTIWKGCTEKKKGEIVRCDFFCHQQGKQPLKVVDPSKEQRNRKSLKCGCKAHLIIILRKSFDIFPQEWHVTKFVVDHNHDLFSPTKMRFLPANQVITIDDEKHIFLLKEVGLSIREVMCVMELERHLKHG